jgi:hypothetical protein
MVNTKLEERGKEHVSEQIERFKKGKLLRTSSGQRLNPHKAEDMDQALAIFYSEAKAGEKRGFGKRTYRGSSRMRPNKA